MFDIADQLLAMLRRDGAVAVATVTGVLGSAPRALGAAMAVGADGAVIGSLSGGCVEGSAYELAVEVLATHEPQLVQFGVSDDDALAVGLSCGGTLEVFIGELHATDAAVAELERAQAGRSAGIAIVVDRAGRGGGTVVDGGGTVVDGAGSGGGIVVDRAARGGGIVADRSRVGRDAVDTICVGTLVSAHPDERAAAVEAGGHLGESEHAGEIERGASASTSESALRSRIRSELRAAVHAGRSALRTIECEGDTVSILYVVSAPPPRMIIVGAVDFASALAQAARLVGYRVTVCDARPVFATAARFPGAEVVVQWPSEYLSTTETDERTVLCALSHDAKFDIPLLVQALRMPLAFVGAMGSRSTHERRVESLREAGLGESELARLHSPIGLDLGAGTPAETAVSILAEIIAARTDATCAPLRTRSGRIHASAERERVRLADAESAGTEKAGSEPAGTEPAGTEPAGTEPAGTEPAGTEPAGTEPAGTEPEAARAWT